MSQALSKPPLTILLASPRGFCAGVDRAIQIVEVALKKYGAPDAYEIAGDNLMVRYLVHHKVAFRMNRLAANKPHQVTGVVVAAGKS